jgi:hypothetical protein
MLLDIMIDIFEELLMLIRSPNESIYSIGIAVVVREALQINHQVITTQTRRCMAVRRPT